MAKRPRQQSLFGAEAALEPEAPGIADRAGEEAACLPRAEDESPPETLAGKTVYAVDAHNLIHQVFHAVPEMTSPNGQPVAAVFGFTRDMFGLIETKKPDYLFCAFDLPGRTFRHELQDDYKANRPDTHVDLAPQFASIHRVLEAMASYGLNPHSVRSLSSFKRLKPGTNDTITTPPLAGRRTPGATVGDCAS